MAIVHCLLNGSGSSGDGSTWDDDSSGTAAYIDGAGLVTALAALAGGDTIYTKGASITDATYNFVGPETIAEVTNPIRVIGVKDATTNTGGSIVQSDLIPGLRTGNSTRAYLQTGADAPPSIIQANQSATINTSGSVYWYGMILRAGNNFQRVANHQVSLVFEECDIAALDANEFLDFGSTSGGNTLDIHETYIHCLLNMDSTSAHFRFSQWVTLRFYDCTINVLSTDTIIETFAFKGNAKFYGCDFTGSTGVATLVDISVFEGGRCEFYNCRMPASHVLTSGTAGAEYYVSNYGSEDNTGFDSADSEQQLETRTLRGTVDIETVKVRTDGADDGATDSGGPFSWAINDISVSDNFEGVVSPWMYIWVEGDGTAKTLTVFLANDSASTDLQDDEVYLEVQFPSEAGISMFDNLPDEGAPADGGGRMQLLGTAADLTDDTGSTWGSGANNHQKLTQSIAPKYRGVVQSRVIYSKSGGPELYVCPKLEIT